MERRISLRGFMGLLLWRVRSTVLTWGVVCLVTDRTGADILGDRIKHPTAKSSTMKGPTAIGMGGLVSEFAGRRAKPWKIVLGSDGLSDEGTPIFCLRRGKSEFAEDCEFRKL